MQVCDEPLHSLRGLLYCLLPNTQLLYQRVQKLFGLLQRVSEPASCFFVQSMRFAQLMTAMSQGLPVYQEELVLEICLMAYQKRVDVFDSVVHVTRSNPIEQEEFDSDLLPLVVGVPLQRRELQKRYKSSVKTLPFLVPYEE